ncbi:MAG: hypothetical protein F4X98_10975 [Gammaproteobacteria bacterium]|nr:hypothetical protein [Gammaproteobacteria bacterium]
MTITRETTLEELAATISQALEAAGVRATLSGGSAVSVHGMNEYESDDLDFVTSHGQAALRDAIEPLGFVPCVNRRQFEHAEVDWLVEFPPGPLAFGDMVVAHEDVPVLETRFGPLRVISPTLSVLDRLAAYYYFNDNQCWDQAAVVARHQSVDWAVVSAWIAQEGQPMGDVERLKVRAGR